MGLERDRPDGAVPRDDDARQVRLDESTTTSGIPTYVAIDPQLAKGQVLSKLPEAVDLYASLYGPYPFDAVGAIVDSAKVVGYSLETQTKPNFPYIPDEATLVHELSHMWFGDSVTLTTWPDIWLHEGFATWSEWIWSERQGNKSAHQWFEQLYNRPEQDTGFWGRPSRPSPIRRLLFNGTVYYRGGMTLQALREKIGDLAFFQLMRTGRNRTVTATSRRPVHRAGREAQQPRPDAVLQGLDLPGGEAGARKLVTKPVPGTTRVRKDRVRRKKPSKRGASSRAITSNQT